MRRTRAGSVLLVALLVAACGGSTPPSDAGSPAAVTTPSAPASAAPASAPASAAPSASSTSSATPVESPAGSPSSEPVGSDVPSDAPTPSATGAGGSADACTGTADNRAFYGHLAASVSWAVYCPVLPSGWFVSTGSYRLANGGKLEISYKGPGGATLALSEGSFCTDGTGCVPSGTDSGGAAFGAMQGTLVTTDAGGFAIVVDRGQQPSWLLVTSGVDQATTASFGAAMARVGG